MSADTLFSIKHFNTVSSTNTLAKDFAIKGEKEFTVILADSQTAGRGRLGRTFYSPENSGIYMSIILRPLLSPADTPLITTAAAVAVCRALKKVCRITPEIKWVNDIYYKSKKVCGILTESSINVTCQSTDFVILGIGINLYENDFPKEIADIAGALFESPPAEETKERLTAEILGEFYKIYLNITDRSFMEDYRNYSLILGKRVFFRKNGEDFYGRAQKIDDDARLTVVLENGEECVLYSGEVSVRLA
ncbi:MAG: biotin--[acetyl-CoA-carboxylase] ligase [Clostridiales bacterium]|nr:biotin--[acetyl-CoA-carboxylase] ligase [Candidatus Equinaster intestinalis]